MVVRFYSDWDWGNWTAGVRVRIWPVVADDDHCRNVGRMAWIDLQLLCWGLSLYLANKRYGQ